MLFPLLVLLALSGGVISIGIPLLAIFAAADAFNEFLFEVYFAIFVYAVASALLTVLAVLLVAVSIRAMILRSRTKMSPAPVADENNDSSATTLQTHGNTAAKEIINDEQEHEHEHDEDDPMTRTIPRPIAYPSALPLSTHTLERATQLFPHPNKKLLLVAAFTSVYCLLAARVTEEYLTKTSAIHPLQVVISSIWPGEKGNSNHNIFWNEYSSSNNNISYAVQESYDQFVASSYEYMEMFSNFLYDTFVLDFANNLLGVQAFVVRAG